MRRRKAHPELEARESIIRRRNRPKRPCPNCGELMSGGGHFFPPCMREVGFFVCDPAPHAQQIEAGRIIQGKTALSAADVYAQNLHR